MPLWRIRITLPDDPHSRELLDQALDGQRVTALNFTPREADAQMAGDVVLELPRDDDLGRMLGALHRISPQVFVSRADDEPAPARRSALASSLVRPTGSGTTEAGSFAASD
jgi:hypothetical protein